MRATPATPASDVVIVAIDDASIARLGEWPWPRDVHASLINRLAADGARVVAFTVPFDTSPPHQRAERLRAALALLESSDLGDSEQAQQLRRCSANRARAAIPTRTWREAMRAHGNVVLPVDVRLADATGGTARIAAATLSERRRGRAARGCARPTSCSRAGVWCSRAPQRSRSHADRAPTATARFAPTSRRCASVTTRCCLRWRLPIAARALGVDAREIELHVGGRAAHRRSQASARTRHCTIRPHYFPSQPPQFAQYPYWRVLAGDVPPAELRDKIVLDRLPRLRRRPRPVTVTTPVERRDAGRAHDREHRDQLLASQGLLAADVCGRARMAGRACGDRRSRRSRCRSPGIGLGALASVLLIAILIVVEIGLLSSSLVWVRFMLPCLGGGRRLRPVPARRADAPRERPQRGTRRSCREQPAQSRPDVPAPGAARPRVRNLSALPARCGDDGAAVPARHGFRDDGARCRKQPTSTLTSRRAIRTTATCARAARA